jgi:hypothetical protein
MIHDNRESWLNAVAAGMAPLFEALRAPLPDRVRVAIGFTSAGRKSRAIRDAVVVVGDSRQEAGDRTWTAIREVSGAELTLNDIRQYAVAPAAPRPSPIGRVLEEWPFFLAGALAIFTAHALMNPHSIDGAKTGNKILLTLRRSFLSVGELVLVAFLSAILFGILLWRLQPDFGRALDFVTPFMAILLEGTFELMHRITLFLHSTLHRLFGLAHEIAPGAPVAHD